MTLVEFFLARDAPPATAHRTVAVAWVGLALIVSHSVYKAWLAVAFTAFFRDFYDVMGAAAALVATGEASSGETSGSGGEGPAVAAAAAAARRAALADIYAQLAVFARLAVPAALVHPLARWMMSRYAMAWRLALVRSYVARWDAAGVAIEGASQRVQEDTQRFAEGLEFAFATALDVVFTLVIFTPKLHALGRHVRPPEALRDVLALDGEGGWRQDWLVLVAVALAALGTVVGLVVARRLVDLEVRNQVVEAAFRLDLSLWEALSTPVQPPARPPRAAEEAGIAEEERATPVAESEHRSDRSDDPAAGCAASLPPFATTTVDRVQQHAAHRQRLEQNYTSLFRHFAYFNAWTGAFDQAVTIVPYLLAAPQLVLAPEEGAAAAVAALSLGEVVELSRIFDRCFSALTTPMNAWGAVNEFRSVLRRLREFERHLPSARAVGRRMQMRNMLEETQRPRPPRPPPHATAEQRRVAFLRRPVACAPPCGTSVELASADAALVMGDVGVAVAEDEGAECRQGPR